MLRSTNCHRSRVPPPLLHTYIQTRHTRAPASSLIKVFAAAAFPDAELSSYSVGLLAFSSTGWPWKKQRDNCPRPHPRVDDSPLNRLFANLWLSRQARWSGETVSLALGRRFFLGCIWTSCRPTDVASSSLSPGYPARLWGISRAKGFLAVDEKEGDGVVIL